MLDSFFNPKSIAVVGVSSDSKKLGSVVFNNIIDAGFNGFLYPVNPKCTGENLYGKQCFASVKDIGDSLDLVVIVVPAKFTMQVIDDCILNKSKNISIISAGFGEVGNHELEDEIKRKCFENNINVLGPNCLGHISTYTNLNASFANGYPERGNVAFISQSGAYCSAMLDWAKEKGIGFSHFISIGNKIDISETDLIKSIKDDNNTSAFIFYLESLKNGQEFLDIARDVAKTKPVVILEPGKSSKAQEASLSHTGSLAPNYRVLEAAFEKNGIIQVYNTREMFGLLEILQYSKHKYFDGNLAILTNAGGVGVLVSDLCEDNHLDLPKPSDKLSEILKSSLSPEASVGNPIDIVGDARSDRYEAALRTLCESNEYKNILVLLTPQMVTDVVGTANIIVKISKEYNNVNIFASFIGGDRVRDGLNILKSNKIICFDYPVDGIKLIGLLKKQIVNRRLNFIKVSKNILPENIYSGIKKSINDNLSSLPQELVNLIMDHYEIDYPKSFNYTNKEKALLFIKDLFPKPFVLKLSSPDAIHKTEMKGIYLNVDSEDKFNEAWDSLTFIINKFSLKNASILIQEMILKSTEVIIGVNSDKTFGKVIVFGSGGIYTEVMKDTSLRLLPTNDFMEMIKETKVGSILNGVRGESPKALEPLIDTIKKVQQIIIDIPEIKSIDINPVLVTNDRAIVVDFKIIL